MTTQSGESAIRLVGDPPIAEVEALREMMLYCVDYFPTYQRLFRAAGIRARFNSV